MLSRSVLRGAERFWRAGAPWQCVPMTRRRFPKATQPSAIGAIFVPAGDVTAWPRNGEKLLPIESSEFQELVTAANRGAESAPHAAIIEAAYFGRLRSDGSVAGHGTWTVQLRGEGPVILPLTEHDLVIRAARWRGEPQRPDANGSVGC